MAILRAGAGLILTWRSGIIAWDSRFYFDPAPWSGGHLPAQAVAGFAETALSLGLVLGVAPRICAFILLLSHAWFSAWTGTYNLTSMLAIPLLGALAVLDTGRFAVAASRRKPLPPELYRSVYLMMFLVYAAMHFQAVLYHLHDRSWTEGRTVAVLLTSSYLSSFYQFFRYLESLSFAGFWAFSIAAVCVQTVFQLGMIPLMLAGWGARFVRFWGWIFILVSLVDLRISVLPLLEVLFWIAIFPPRILTSLLRAGTDEPEMAGSRLSSRRMAVGVFAGTYAILLGLFFLNAFSGLLFNARLPYTVRHTVFYYAGLVAPNVFNETDLEMGDRWAVIERIEDGHCVLVPFDGPDGDRLSFHVSDLLYFGNSLKWRRGMINAGDLVAYHSPGQPGYEFARQIARYDHRRRGMRGPETYRVTLFRNRASEHSGPQAPSRYRPDAVLQFTIVADDPKN